MSDDKVIESHTPLLGLKQIDRLNDLSKGLKLHKPDDQAKFLARVDKVMSGMKSDHLLEYLVNNADVPIGSVNASVKLNCNAARRIHWGLVQVKRHKAGNDRSVAAKVSEMAGSHS